MRGRSSSAKSRLRSAGYKCNLCGRRVIDAETLERHQKTIHNISPKGNKVNFKAKPSVQRSKLSNKVKDKVFDDLIREKILTQSKLHPKQNKNINENLRNRDKGDLAEEGKIISNKEIEQENGESLLVEKEKRNKRKQSKDVSKRVEFECPLCAKTFNIYFTAHKHIQKFHSVNADGKKVPPNSQDLVQPIRVEQCYKCDIKIRSNEHHVCPNLSEEAISIATEFVCSGCNQVFVSLKTFDMHVAGLHSDAVDSMFFPTKIEFTNWRLEMERQTNAKYSLFGEYESKKIYRCNHAREEAMENKSYAYFCPSSMVVQDFSKGIQVHFYNKHYDHTANPYMLSSNYKKYSITSFLKNPSDDGNIKSAAYSMKLDDADLQSQFKKLMDSIVLNTADADVSMLKILIEKALDMSALLTDVAASQPVPTSKTSAKSMSDKEITEALEMQTVLLKRRRSVDSCEVPPKPAKRTRNKSLFNQSETRMSPKIVNTFSLASNSNSDEFKSDNGDDFDLDFGVNTNDKIGYIQNKSTPEPNAKTNKSNKINTRLTNFNESLSFNDSYKDFIDKNFIGKADKTKDAKSSKNTVKTKLGAFKQISPKKVEHKDNNSNDIPANNKNIGGIKAISSVCTTEEEANLTPKSKTIDIETPSVNILSVENPNVTITKVSTIRMDTPKVTSTQVKPHNKLDTSKGNTKGAFSHLVDPLQVNITKVNKSVSTSSVKPHERKISKVNSRRDSSLLVDPLELNITKVKSKNISSALVEPVQRNASKLSTRSVLSPSVDPLKINNTKLKADTPKINTPKAELPKYISKVQPTKLNTPKVSTPKIYADKATTKVNNTVITKTTPKLPFEEKSTYSRTKNTTPHKIPELKYEVREQENDCNILVLKL